ncbi:MAG: translation initiation factor 1 [Candidatus Woesearchaeota archaeon]|nr:translation initiation factor 1 [Candidatus Woesearchaeota archaeon]
MSEICPRCGLPKELCVCDSIARESQIIEVKTVKRRFGKVYTVVQGIADKDIDLKGLTKELKNKLACGGTYKNGVIELQGDHKSRVKEYLTQAGFKAESIRIK